MAESEFGYIHWLQKRLKYSPDVLVGSGDDAAVVKIPKNSQLHITTDTIVEGVDFRLNKAAPEQIGYKSVAISISDLAAMGGGFDRIYAVISYSSPKRLFNSNFIRPLFNGINGICKRFDIQLIGGDISSTSGPLTITSTLFGVRSNLKPPIQRSGARVGDAIMITGKLGGSILGRHLSFTPRLKEATILSTKYQINSMIDISDGLLADLGHILYASNVGALIAETSIPISPDVYRLESQISNLKSQILLRHALTDGEDFELLFTAPMKEAVRIIKDKELRKLPVSLIGIIRNKKGIYMLNRKGKVSPLKEKGFVHF